MHLLSEKSGELSLCKSLQLNELKDELQPLVQMVKDGKIPPGKVSIFVHIPQSASDTCNIPYKPSFVYHHALDFFLCSFLDLKFIQVILYFWLICFVECIILYIPLKKSLCNILKLRYLTSFSFSPKGGRLPQDKTTALSQVSCSHFLLRPQNLNLRTLFPIMNDSYFLFCLKQLLHKYQLLFGFESKTDSSSQPSCD